MVLLVERYCPVCGRRIAFSIDEMEYRAWVRGVPAQEAFPTLDAAAREFVISGICESCWEKMGRGED